MKTTARIATIGGVAAAGALLFTGPAAASPVHQSDHKPVQQPTHRPTPQPAGAVFVQTDNLAGNTVLAYEQAADGTLTQAGIYPTGGLGGQLTGSAVDHTGLPRLARL
jgi:hypothetical protein